MKRKTNPIQLLPPDQFTTSPRPERDFLIRWKDFELQAGPLSLAIMILFCLVIYCMHFGR